MDLVERCHHTSRFMTLDKRLNRHGNELTSGHFQFSSQAFHLLIESTTQRDFYPHCHLSSPQWLSRAIWKSVKLSVH